MNWIDFVIDLIHLAWFEVTQMASWIFRRTRKPLMIYTFVVVLTIVFALASIIWVFVGLENGSQTMIFTGGIALLLDIIVIAVILFPAALGINILGTISAKILGDE